MKVLAPLTNIDNYEALIEAGSDEFYFGIVPLEWQQKYINSIIPLNRREHLLYKPNSISLDSLRILKRKFEQYKVPVKITINSHYYGENQYQVIENIIKSFIDLGFDTFIIADLALIVHLNERNIKCNIHLSGDFGLLNSSAISFLNQFNITRYIIPRKTTLGEIESLIKNDKSSNEYEAFILNEWCFFSGALCNSYHCDEMNNFCEINYHTRKKDSNSNKFPHESQLLRYKEELLKIQREAKSNTGNISKEVPSNENYNSCGLCRIKELMEIGITHLKIVGRGQDLNFIKFCVKDVKRLVTYATKENNNTIFTKFVKNEIYNGKCPRKCYYPRSKYDIEHHSWSEQKY